MKLKATICIVVAICGLACISATGRVALDSQDEGICENSHEQESKLLQQCFDLYGVLTPRGLTASQRIAALQKLTNPASLIYVSIFSAKMGSAGKVLVCRRSKDDPMYLAAKERLSGLSLKSLYKDLDYLGTGQDAAKYKCDTHHALKLIREGMSLRIDCNQVDCEPSIPTYAKDEDAGAGFRLVFESLAALPSQRKLYEFLKQDRSHLDGVGEIDPLLAMMRSGEDEVALDFADWLYREDDRYTKTYTESAAYQKLKKSTYGCLSPKGKVKFALMIAKCMPDEYASKGYDFAFEKQVFVENAASLREVYGLESNKHLDYRTILGKFYNLIYNDVKRQPFEGLFGVKFGAKVDVSNGRMVSASGLDFIRVSFVPEIKSKAFERYDLCVTKITHKVFAIQAFSKEELTWMSHEQSNRVIPPLVASLEKKYKTMSVDFGPGWELTFPDENCNLKVIGNTKFKTKQESVFGREISEKIISVVCKYLTLEQGELHGMECSVIAESGDLLTLAVKESKIAKKESAKESDLRKQIEAQSAADAF